MIAFLAPTVNRFVSGSTFPVFETLYGTIRYGRSAGNRLHRQSHCCYRTLITYEPRLQSVTPYMGATFGGKRFSLPRVRF